MLLTDLYAATKSAGLDVYLAGQADGECRAARVVIADAGVVPDGKTVGRHMFLVTGFVPIDRSTDIFALMAAARAAIVNVDGVRPTGETSEGEVLDEIKAYAVTAEYYALCAL